MIERRAIKRPEEQDVYTGWRKVLAWTSRPGAVKAVKRRTHHRERQEARRFIERERYSQTDTEEAST